MGTVAQLSPFVHLFKDMYWIAKIFQAAGLAVMAWGFIKNFPRLMPHNIFLLAGLFFIMGWIVQSYMLKK